MSGNRTMTAAVLLKDGAKGAINVKYGTFVSAKLKSGKGQIRGERFETKGPARIEIAVRDTNVGFGKFPTIVHVDSERNPFSFCLRDVTSANPIYIPEYGAAVVPPDDSRDYAAVKAAVKALGAVSDFQRFENEPEESYEAAARENRVEPSPTWLGLGRDMRLFRVYHQRCGDGHYGFWGEIDHRDFCYPATAEGFTGKEYVTRFAIGQGASCRPQIKRWLEDDCLPILRSTQKEDDVTYHLTFFASLENGPVRDDNVRGSDWLATYCKSGGNMLTAYKADQSGLSEKECEELAARVKEETEGREEELVCFIRIEAVNDGKVPRYAWLKTPWIAGPDRQKLTESFDETKGFSTIGDKVFAVSRLNGEALKEWEIAALIPAGGRLTFDLMVPHRPISVERAEKLARQNFTKHLDACAAYWRKKLAAAAKFHIPEKTIDNCVKAGLLHCDLIAFGKRAEGPLLETIGWYAPIGSESAPIIDFFERSGLHEQAARCIEFFFARQRNDGFIQNFAGYQLETGPVLWRVGEHYRYTRDRAWLEKIKPNVLKAIAYLLAWRERNKNEEYRAAGYYGMIEGKVADCNDFYHSFMLNAVTYLGLKRAAEFLADVAPETAERLNAELPAYRKDIRDGFYYALGRAPVVPIGDGSWAPLPPPWVEYTGGISLYADGGRWFTHGAFASRSCLTGPLYLVLGEVLDPDEIGTDFLLKTNEQPVTKENAALSQPYYCRHDYAHIRRGEVKPFLKLYYNQLTGLHDRETYTMWEHYHHASQHKTHEEGWFLCQTAWALFIENGDTLELLKGVPRKWLETGKTIAVEKAATYFGQLSFSVESKLAKGEIAVAIKATQRPPKMVTVRLPAPDGKKAVRVKGGEYDPETETVTIRNFSGKASISLYF